MVGRKTGGVDPHLLTYMPNGRLYHNIGVYSENLLR